MGILDRGALRRAERVLAPFMVAGEKVIEFDIGKMGRARIDCIASTHALYFVEGGRGEPARVPYEFILRTSGGPSWFGILTLQGASFTVDFGRAPRKFADVVVEQYRKVAQQRRQFRASWAGGAATFTVGRTADRNAGDQVLYWSVDGPEPEPPHALTQTMIVDQAHNELLVSLGQDPIEPNSSLTNIAWDPPLRTLR